MLHLLLWLLASPGFADDAHRAAELCDALPAGAKSVDCETIARAQIASRRHARAERDRFRRELRSAKARLSERVTASELVAGDDTAGEAAPSGDGVVGRLPPSTAWCAPAECAVVGFAAEMTGRRPVNASSRTSAFWIDALSTLAAAWAARERSCNQQQDQAVDQMRVLLATRLPNARTAIVDSLAACGDGRAEAAHRHCVAEAHRLRVDSSSSRACHAWLVGRRPEEFRERGLFVPAAQTTPFPPASAAH